MRILGIILVFIFITYSTSLYAKDGAKDRARDSLQRVLHTAGTISETRFKALKALSRSYWFVNTDSVLYYANEIMHLSVKADNLPYKIEALNEVGVAYWHKSDYKKALHYFLQAKEIFINNPKVKSNIESKIYNNLGLVYTNLGDYMEAIESYSKAIAIFTTKKDYEGIARSTVNIGHVYMALDEVDSAIDQFKSAVTFYKTYGDDAAVIANSLNDIGISYLQQKKYDSAYTYFVNSNKEALVLNQNLLLGVNYFCLAHIAHKRGNDNLAFENIENSMEFASVLGYTKLYAKNHQLTAKIYQSKNNFKAAKDYFEKAYDIYLKLGFKKELYKCSRALVKINTALKKYEEAAFYASKSFIYIDSLDVKNTANVTYKERYAMQQAKHELKTVTEINALKYKHNILMLSVLIFFIGCLALVFFLGKRKYKKEHALVKEAIQAKVDFFTRVTHALKKPLNTVTSFTALLKSNKITEEAKLSYLKIISEASHELSYNIATMMDLATTENKQTTLQNKVFNFYKAIDEITVSLAPNFEQKNVVFEVFGLDKFKDILVYGDKEIVQQIVLNILLNAQQRTKKGFVHLILSQGKPSTTMLNIVIKINDTGTITKTKIPKIFEAYSGDKKHNSENNNTSGLPLVKYLTQLMGGKVRVEKGLQNNTMVTLKVTLKLAGNSVEIAKKMHDAYKPNKTGRTVVLVVEDSPINTVVINRYIHTSFPSFKIITAENGADGVAQFYMYSPDVIIMDMHMPIMNGIDAFKIIRKSSPNVPILLMNKETPSVKELKNENFKFLQKPISKVALVSLLGTVVNQQAHLEEDIKDLLV